MKISLKFTPRKLFVAAIAITTLRNRVGEGESHFFGGIFFARAENTAIITIADLRGKTIAASSILLMGSGQTQWQEMRKFGLDLLVDGPGTCPAANMNQHPTALPSQMPGAFARRSFLPCARLNCVRAGHPRRIRPVPRRARSTRRPRRRRVIPHQMHGKSLPQHTPASLVESARGAGWCGRATSRIWSSRTARASPSSSISACSPSTFPCPSPPRRGTR
jgi:hypothetical protein